VTAAKKPLIVEIKKDCVQGGVQYFAGQRFEIDPPTTPEEEIQFAYLKALLGVEEIQ
jgi:hypothetical protein